MIKKLNTSPIGILSTISSPLLPYLIQNLVHFGLTNICVILDEKDFSEKDKNIWNQRTDGAFDYGPSIYDFSHINLALYPVKNHNSAECTQLIRKLGLLVLLNGGTPRKLNSQLLNSTQHGVINVHPGILPKYRGSSCVEWAIFNDDPIGNSAHFMSEEYDEGPIIKIETYDFSHENTYTSIRVRVYKESLRLMAETVNFILENNLFSDKFSPQNKGHFFPPIPDEKMDIVLSKIKNNTYKY